jgi:hypothetical protein
MTAAVLIPSHKKVAWAWLDRLLGKRPGPREEPPPAAAMSPRERERVLERAYEQMKDELTGWIRAEIPALRRQQAQIAGRHGLDVTYFDWFLMNGQSWPSLPTAARRGLRAMQKIFMFFGAVPNHWNDMIIPDMDELRQRDAALREFGDWFVKTVVRKIERKYIQMVHRKAQELVNLFRGRGGGRDPAASILLMRDFEKRLVGDRFTLRPAVVGVVDLFS